MVYMGTMNIDWDGFKQLYEIFETLFGSNSRQLVRYLLDVAELHDIYLRVNNEDETFCYKTPLIIELFLPKQETSLIFFRTYDGKTRVQLFPRPRIPMTWADFRKAVHELKTPTEVLNFLLRIATAYNISVKYGPTDHFFFIETDRTINLTNLDNPYMLNFVEMPSGRLAVHFFPSIH